MAMESKHIISLLVVSIILIILYMSYGKDKRYKKDKKKGKSVKENFVDEMMREDNGTFSLFNWGGNNDETADNIEEDTIENFPQTTPMNVIYTDTNGNLSNTSDLGLQNLTVNSDTKLSGNVGIGGLLTSTNAGVELNGDTLTGPSKNTRINSQGIIFGGTNNGRQGDSAQITAGKHRDSTLCIVGMSKDNGWESRKIEMWAEGGTTHNGSIQVNGDVNASGNINAISLNRNSGDWLRINDNGESVGRTALYGKLSINNTKKGHGGLSVGDWDKDVGQGNIYATGNVSSGGNVSTSGTVSSQRVVVGDSMDYAMGLSVQKGGNDWAARIHNPTSGGNVFMSHGDKYGMHINANNKGKDTYILQCYAGDKGVMNVYGNGNVDVSDNITAGGTLKCSKICIGNTCIGEKELKYLTTGFYIQAANLPRSDNDGNRWNAGGNVHMWKDGYMRIADPASAFNFAPVNGV